MPPALFFGVHKVPQTPASARLGAARMESNAARAIAAGLGRARSSTPPSLYAYDPDTGRLAVTTRAYNTAVMAVSQGAFPYGGLELARLYDADQEVAGNVGGLPPASFGLVVDDLRGRRLLATQHPRRLLRAHAAAAPDARALGRRRERRPVDRRPRLRRAVPGAHRDRDDARPARSPRASRTASPAAR